MNHNIQRLIAIIAFVCLLPLLGLVAVLIYVIDGGPVMFTQDRIGQHQRQFRIVKFRTMHRGTDSQLGNHRQPPGSRITRTGSLLRKFGIDELPQLLNVVRGHMALIGPRALLPEVAVNVPRNYAERFTVLPGITGLAQVSGRNELLWSERLRLDTVYAERRSLWLDIKIAVRTIGVLITGQGFAVDRTTARTDDLGLIDTQGRRDPKDQT